MPKPQAGLGKPAVRSGREARSAVGLAIVIVFFLASGTVAWVNTNILRDDNARIEHSHAVMTSIDALFSAMQDAETGQRGYLLTGRQSYLDPYTQALAAVDSRLEEVDALTRDNPVQQARIAPLRREIAAKLAELKDTIALYRDRGAAAALAVVETDRGKQAMDAVRARLDRMQLDETQLREARIAEMQAAYRTAWLSGILSCLIGIALTVIVGFLIRRASMARDRQEWLQTGLAGLSSAMLGDPDSVELGASVLRYLTGFLGAQAAAMFVGDGLAYRRTATYGTPADANIVEHFAIAEGLLGKVAAERIAAVLSDIPDGYLTIGSALGRDRPRHIAIAPAIADNVVLGVVELGFLQPVDEAALAFLQDASGLIGVAVRSARLRADLQQALDHSQRQSDELQVQSEELRVSNEELEEQGRALRESQVRLEQQQAELEQTNVQLEEQAERLEAQRNALTRSNAAIELKAREVEQASRYKTDFLANMSHELRTPLNSLLILSKLLGDNATGNLTGEQVKYARTINASGNDLLTLINDILDLSKIEAGHMEIRSETVQLQRLAQDMRQVFDPLAAERQLQFDIAIAAECPRAIVTDRQRLEQILKNLLSNAFKFTEAGSVRVSLQPGDNGTLRIAVADTGIGISADKQKEIFDAFRQADGTISRRYGGTGLGLSISRELARLLGGSIAIASTPGEGSRFTLTVPLAYDPALVVPRQAPSPPPSADIAERGPEKPAAARPRGPAEDDRDQLGTAGRILLVVEDDRQFAGIVRDLAHEMGFQCLVAATAEEALELARAYKPSAVVLDVGLPDQSGLAVLDRLKRDTATRHIPVHVVSGSDHTQTAMSLGAIGYLVKPVKREDLAHVLESLAEKLMQGVRRVLVVEDDPVQRGAVASLLSSGDVKVVGVGTAAECLERLQQETFDCMVLDLSLPDASGFSLLETLSATGEHGFPPVIVYTGHDLSPHDEQRLRRYSDSIIIKGARSPERLLDEVSLFLHQVVTDLPPEHQKMIARARSRDDLLQGRRILVVEDDVRNVYSLTSILEPRGAIVEIARNGQEAIDALEQAAGDGAAKIDLVLMDVMMPVMDGLTATRRIRTEPRWKKLPILALTAKAMPDDQQRCIEAGANDYMSKPLDVDKLLSLIRVWMPR